MRNRDPAAGTAIDADAFAQPALVAPVIGQRGGERQGIAVRVVDMEIAFVPGRVGRLEIGLQPGSQGARILSDVVPPAIANALYSATGVRFRRLPLLSEGL